MRGDDVHKLARRDRLGFLPEPREMPLVAGHEIVGTRGLGALQELVVVRVARQLERTGGRDGMAMALDELEQLLAESLADFKFGAGEHLLIFCQNIVRDIEAGGFGDRQQEYSALASVG